MTKQQEEIVKEIIRLEDALLSTVQELDNMDNECCCAVRESYSFAVEGFCCLSCGGYIIK